MCVDIISVAGGQLPDPIGQHQLELVGDKRQVLKGPLEHGTEDVEEHLRVLVGHEGEHRRHCAQTGGEANEDGDVLLGVHRQFVVF